MQYTLKIFRSRFRYCCIKNRIGIRKFLNMELIIKYIENKKIREIHET